MNRVIISLFLSVLISHNCFADTCSDALVSGKVFSSASAQTACGVFQSSIASDIVGTGNPFTIRTNTADGADTKSTLITGGGSAGSSRGASLLLYGNENAGDGAVVLSGGEDAGSNVIFRIDNAAATLQIQNSSEAAMWSFGDTGVLTQDATNGGSVVLTKGSTAIAQPVVVGISAAGTVQGDATALTGVFNEVTTTGSGAGVRLRDNPAGSEITIVNKGANALLVYPPSGGTIYGQSLNAATSIATTSFVRCFKTAALLYSCTESPVS